VVAPDERCEPRSGGRIQHSASRGKKLDKWASPEGAKERVTATP